MSILASVLITHRGDGDTGVVAIGEAVCVAVNVGVGISVGATARSEVSSCVCDCERGVPGGSVREELQDDQGPLQFYSVKLTTLTGAFYLWPFKKKGWL